MIIIDEKLVKYIIAAIYAKVDERYRNYRKLKYHYATYITNIRKRPDIIWWWNKHVMSCSLIASRSSYEYDKYRNIDCKDIKLKTNLPCLVQATWRRHEIATLESFRWCAIYFLGDSQQERECWNWFHLSWRHCRYVKYISNMLEAQHTGYSIITGQYLLYLTAATWTRWRIQRNRNVLLLYIYLIDVAIIDEN